MIDFRAEEIKPSDIQYVALVGTDKEKTLRTAAILNKFFTLIDRRLKISTFSNMIDLLNTNIPERMLVISNESAFKNQEDLHFLKMLKSRFNSATIVHTYKRFAPTHMDDLVVNATTKFVKEDVLFEQNFERSLNVLYSTKFKQHGS